MKYFTHQDHLEIIPETDDDRKLIKDWWSTTDFHRRPSVVFTPASILRCWDRVIPEWLKLHNWKDL